MSVIAPTPSGVWIVRRDDDGSLQCIPARFITPHALVEEHWDALDRDEDVKAEQEGGDGAD